LRPSTARLGAWLRTLLGMAAGLLARAWLRTLRLTVVADPSLDRKDGRPWVLAFWHGEQFALLAWPRRRPTAVLVSMSSDGDIQAASLRALGLVVVRGSSSRGGAVGLLALARRLGRGHDGAFAVDGPRGPSQSVAPGARAAAARAGALIVPMGSACPSGHTFGRAWDRYRLPWPFGKAAVVLGAPADPRTVSDEAIGVMIAEASRRAAAEVRRAPPPPGDSSCPEPANRAMS
jgi:lysophospholipid acyltransferase (LPLAT)-like uncharacterized protein